MQKRMKKMLAFAFVLSALVVVYFAGALCVFDFFDAAYPDDEDSFNGVRVAFGPRPREFFCKPSWEGVAYNGREWPFLVYRPVCAIWRSHKGYATPAEWRSN